MTASTLTLRAVRMNPKTANLTLAFFGMLGLILIAFSAGAATTTGTALLTAYTALNDMINGYAVAAIGYIAANATSVIMKFVGYAIFLGVGLAAATTLVGAVI